MEYFMKKLFFSFVFFLAILLVGCQENSVTNPVSPDEAQKANTQGISSTTGEISLDGILKYPGPVNTYYSLKGSISYNLQMIPGKYVPAGQNVIRSAEKTSTNSPNSIDEPYYIKLTLYIEATIDNFDRAKVSESYISSKSVSYLYQSVDGYYKVEKLYAIEGSLENLSLMCRFHVTANSIKLDGRWLLFKPGTTGNFVTKPVNSQSSELTAE
jgi:hypothetical protein